MMTAPGQIAVNPSKLWPARFVRRLVNLWDRWVHRRCLPPLRYPMTLEYREKAKGPTAFYVKSAWPIEFTDLDHLKANAETLQNEGHKEPLKDAVEAWIDRRSQKVAEIYVIRAREAFREIGWPTEKPSAGFIRKE